MGASTSFRLSRARSTKAFLAGQGDRYWLARRFLCFQTSARITGYLLWGTPGREELDELERMVVAMSRALGPHPHLADVSVLEGSPLLVFEHMQAFAHARRGERRSSLSKTALVHGTGIAGAAMAGFAAVVEPPCVAQSFGSLSSALAWLSAADAAGLSAELEHLRDVASGRPRSLRQIRAVIDAALPDPDEQSVAEALGISRRTLQRRLTEVGTTFMREVIRARVNRGVTLLELTSDPVSRIAIDVGFTYGSRFSMLVKRTTGLTPTEIRDRRRSSARIST